MSTYVYRRELHQSDRMKAVGIGAGVGLGAALAAGYLARVFLQRTPLRQQPVAAAGEGISVVRTDQGRRATR